jgi:polyisoprenoid-binding protein YceI
VQALAHSRRISRSAVLVTLLLLATPVAAEELRLVLDPAATQISFTLGARLHTVRGKFDLSAGEIAFDPDTGAASGEIRVDARSGDTGIDRRDRVMHEEVLDSVHHPLLVLRPERIVDGRRDGDAFSGRLFGRFEVRGVSHPVTVDFEGERAGERGTVNVRFDVPWVAWGLPDPSNAILAVEDVLHVDVRAAGALSSAAE